MVDIKKIVIVFWLGFLMIMNNSDSHARDNDQYEKRRAEMVKTQIERRGVHDARVLAAMKKVERHLFVPSGQRDLAYEDYPLSIGLSQTISQPYIVAFMTELLNPKKTDVILEVGTGSGYQAAVLAELVSTVCSIEIIPELAARAKNLLQELGYTNVQVKTGDGYLGWEEHAPFDGIIITAAAEEVPLPLVKQLRNGGRMVLPVNAGPSYQMLKIIEKDDTGKVREKDVIPVRFVPLVRQDTSR